MVISSVVVSKHGHLLSAKIRYIDAINVYAAFFLFALAFFPSERGRGVTTNWLTFDFVLVL